MSAVASIERFEQSRSLKVDSLFVLLPNLALLALRQVPDSLQVSLWTLRSNESHVVRNVISSLPIDVVLPIV
jgi:hypothetical protein